MTLTEPHDAHGRAARFVTAETADGAKLILKRKPRPNGPPVLFLHGICSNADMWDLPPIATRTYTFRSLADTLYDAGFDVWLLNFRGHGAPHMYSAPPPHLDDWTLDHLALCDVPAAVDVVRRRTQQRPVVIAASLGAMSLAAYLQGADFAAPPGVGVVGEAAAAKARQAQLAAAAFVVFPAALRWPTSCYRPNGRFDWQPFWRQLRRFDAGSNPPFEIFARSAWLEARIAARGALRFDRLQPSGRGEALLARLPRRLANWYRDAEVGLVQAGIHMLGAFAGRTNHQAEIVLRGRRYVIDHAKAGVLRQTARCIRRGAFVSAHGDPPYVYSDHYDRIALPSLVITGGRDRIANADVARTAFYEQITSRDKDLWHYPELAHGEIQATPAAVATIYPRLLTWVRQHADAPPQAAAALVT